MRNRYVLLWCAVIIAGLCAGSSWAATELAWDRNTETDMKEYRIYACLTKGCTAVKGATPTATVPQVAVGTVPTWTLPVNSEGAAIVTAVDLDSNESAGSNMVPFDTKAPASPSNARTR